MSELFAIPDLPIPKILRVRALRASQWLLSDETVSDLCVAIVSTQAAEQIAEWIYFQQHETQMAMTMN